MTELSYVGVVRDGDAWVPIRFIRCLSGKFWSPWEALDRDKNLNSARKAAASWAKEKGWNFKDVQGIKGHQTKSSGRSDRDSRSTSCSLASVLLECYW